MLPIGRSQHRCQCRVAMAEDEWAAGGEDDCAHRAGQRERRADFRNRPMRLVGAQQREEARRGVELARDARPGRSEGASGEIAGAVAHDGEIDRGQGGADALRDDGDATRSETGGSWPPTGRWNTHIGVPHFTLCGCFARLRFVLRVKAAA